MFHNHQIGLIKRGLVIATIVQPQTDMNIVQADFLIGIQIENIEIDA
jgi:hypothetical protein